MLDIELQDGDILEYRVYSKQLKDEMIVFRAYIHGDISPEFIANNTDIFTDLPISGKVLPKPYIIGNIKPFAPTLIEVPPEDKHKWQPVSSLKDKVVFVLVHGINTEEILLSDPDQYDIWRTPYKYYIWDKAHEHIYKNIENATILHYIYPSSMERLKTHAQDLRDKLLNTDIDKAKAIFLIGHSMGGLVIRQTLHCSKWLRDITTHVFTLNTPHRGSPLASLMFTPPEFWQWLENRIDEDKLTLVRNIRLIASLTAHSGDAVMSQGYLDLRWDTMDKINNFKQMLSPEIYNLNTTEQFSRYTFTTSTIPRKNISYPINKVAEMVYRDSKNLIILTVLQKLVGTMEDIINEIPWNENKDDVTSPMNPIYYTSKDHVGLILLQKLMEAMGEVIGTGLWQEGDGMVPVSSQIPVKYVENGFIFDVLGPMTADHIDIFTSPKVWSAIVEKVKTYI